MAVTVTHPFVSAIADGTDASLVRPSNWNATHSIAGILDVVNGGSGVSTGTGTGNNVLSTAPALSNPTITNYVETTNTANTSTAITIDLATGTIQNLTLTGSPTITMPTATSGKSFIMYLRTGAGSFTVTWATVKWAGSTAPTITATASRMDIYSFFADGTNWYGVIVGQNYTP